MQEIVIAGGEAEQRLDKYLSRYLPDAPKSLIYKSFRKKNITLNGKKAEGSEKLAEGDVIRIFFTDETIAEFQKSLKAAKVQEKSARKNSGNAGTGEKRKKYSKEGAPSLTICYEDAQVLFISKPCGVLSQKSRPSDYSLSEQVADYVSAQGTGITFRPGISNRLDRNTSGLVLAGKTHPAVVALDQMIADRSVKKEYLTVVRGVLDQPKHLSGWLWKDEKTNTVQITDRKETAPSDASYIQTAYLPVSDNGRETLLLVELITGKSHQIRAHLASIGHPLAGDAKYGNQEYNKKYCQTYGLEHQLLHSWRVTFPKQCPKSLEALAGKSFTAPLTKQFTRILQGQKLNLNAEAFLNQ